MALNTAALNLMANELAGAGLYMALHTAAPNASGSNETTAARKAAGWGPAASGTIATGGPLAFTGGAASGPVTHASIWSAITGGTFYGSAPLTGDASFNSAGEYTLNSFTITGT